MAGGLDASPVVDEPKVDNGAAVVALCGSPGHEVLDLELIGQSAAAPCDGVLHPQGNPVSRECCGKTDLGHENSDQAKRHSD